MSNQPQYTFRFSRHGDVSKHVKDFNRLQSAPAYIMYCIKYYNTNMAALST